MADSFIDITGPFDSPRKLLRVIDSGLTDDNGTATVYLMATASGLAIPPHDYIVLTYTGDNLTGVVFKSGGSGGTTVATLTLAYTGSTLTSVTKT